MNKYNHKEIEKKWQERWQQSDLYKADDNSQKPKKYILDMFPYPSGEGLHVGHPEGYTATDIYCRFLRYKGFNVLHPMGWDAFGLPAENYAIKTGTQPRVTTQNNIDNFKRQIKSLGFSYDWDREVNTTDPEYYKWTQWIFLQLFKKGLAYEDIIAINWCPSCKTGIANEEVVGGACDRCHTKVEKKDMKQWMLRITKYADRLLNGLDKLDWPESIKAMQRNWIGKSEGVEVDFIISKYDAIVLATENKSKKARVEKILSTIGLNCKVYSPSEVGMKIIDVEENGTLLENAIDKAKRYHGKTDLPILALDTGLFIDGEEIDPVKVKRNALAGADDSKLTQEQVGTKMHNYYKEIATKRGGRVDGYWLDAWALVTTDGKVQTIESKRPIILTDQRHGDIDYYFPLRSLYISKDTGKYIADQNEEDEKKELNSIAQILKQLLTDKLTVFTTRPDTLFGATYMVVCPEHQLITKNSERITNLKEVQKYITKAKNKSDLERAELSKEKTGVELQGLKAINPLNNQEIPIWTADYVLSGYGTGAIMAVPAHDERDWEFATKFKIPIIEVVQGNTEDKCFTGEGIAINSGDFNGLSTSEFKNKIIEWLEENKVGKKSINYKLRDWVFSRQRYWGEPIPLVHCDECVRIVKENAIDINFYNQDAWQRIVNGDKIVETRALNPEEKDRYFGDIKEDSYIRINNKITGEEKYLIVKQVWKFDNLEKLFQNKNILEKIYSPNPIPATLDDLQGGYSFTPDYLERINKNGLIAWEIKLVYPGIVPLKEDELPLELPVVEKYEPTGTGESPLANIDEWVNVKCRACGAAARRETNTMPQWAGSSWYWLRYTDPKNDKKFAAPDKLKYWLPVDTYVGGAEHAVLHLLYARFWNMVLFDLGVVPVEEPFQKLLNQGLILGPDGEKMSKSRGNVINPDDVVDEYGADTLRMYEMFMGPFEAAKPWDTKGIIGIRRFLEKVENIKIQNLNINSNSNDKLINKLIKKVSEDIEGFRFNTAISAMMIFVNEMNTSMNEDTMKKFLIVISPFAPHLAEELWSQLGNKDSIFKESWPEYDPSLVKDEEFELVVQVNGKVRDKLTVKTDITQEEVEALIKQSDKIKKYLDGKEIKIIVYIKNRLINIVI